MVEGSGLVWYGEPNPRDGGVAGPGEEGSDDEENVGDGVGVNRTCFPSIMARLASRVGCNLCDSNQCRAGQPGLERAHS